MKLPFSLVLVYFAVQLAFAATVKVRVISSKTQRPVPRAEIVLPGLKLHAFTDSAGISEIVELDPGNYMITVAADGFQAEEFGYITAIGGRTVNYQLMLRPVAGPGKKTILVTDERPLLAPKPEGTKYNVKQEDMEAVPASMGDIFRVVHTLPGVVAHTDFSSSYSVRGGNFGENLIMLDGIPIEEPLHFQGLPASFNILNFDMLRTMQFYTGNFPVQYGNKVGSVLDVKYRNGSNERFKAKLSYDLKWLNALAEGPLPGKWGSFIISGRRSYLRWMLGNITINNEEYMLPQFYDLQGKLFCNLNSRSQISLLYYAVRDNAALPYENLGEIVGDKEIGFHFADELVGISLYTLFSQRLHSQHNLSYYNSNHMFGLFNGPLDGLNPELVAGHWVEELGSVEVFDSEQKYKNLARVVFNGKYDYQLSSKYKLLFGYEFGNNDAYFYDVELQPSHIYISGSDSLSYYRAKISNENHVEYYYMGLHLDNKISIGRNLESEMGVRYDYSSVKKDSYFVPRLNVLANIDGHTRIKFGAGIYNQPDYALQKNTSAFRPVNAVHYSTSLEKDWLGHFVAKCEGYYKDLRLSDNDYRLKKNNLYSVAKGAEWFLKWNGLMRSSGWISYSLAKAEFRDLNQAPSSGDIKLLAGTSFEPCMLDQRHTLNIVCNYKVFKNAQLSLVWRYGSGLPKWRLYGWEILEHQKFEVAEDERYPSYKRLDIKLTGNHSINIIQVTWMLEVINALNAKNVFPYYYYKDWDTGEDEYYYMLPLMPSIGLEVTF